MSSSIGRAAIRRLVSRPAAVSNRVAAVSQLVARDQFSSSSINSTFARTFATRLVLHKQATTDGKAKATTAAKKTTASTTKKATAKKPATKKPAKAKAKKPAVKKPATKPKKPTPEEKEKLLLKTLKKKSLLTEERRLKYLPANSWGVYMVENLKPGVSPMLQMPDLSRSYKFLSTSELSRLQETAKANHLQNSAIFKAWVETNPPLAVREANSARGTLRKKFDLNVRDIKDDRQPEKPHPPYILFCKAKWASGDFANTPVVEASRQLGEQWKALSDKEKEPYEELYNADVHKYKKTLESLEA